MKTIWKYALPSPHCVLLLPAGAKVVHLAVQAPSIFNLWAIVEISNPHQPRPFTVVGTGQPIPPESRYVGTFMDGAYVWHLFEPETGT